MKVISGGQTGADRAALETARGLGIPTGGTVPKGWKTENGSDPSLQAFGCVESPYTQYPPRTRANVSDSDGTVWFGGIGSMGYRCTAKATRDFGKPFIQNPTASQLLFWIRVHKIQILNVAGNRASKNPHVAAQVKAVLSEAFPKE